MVLRNVNSCLIWYNHGMSNRKKAQGRLRPKITVVKPDVNWGLYMWRLPTGRLFTDDQGNYLAIRSFRGDIEKIAEIRKAAAYYGQPDGKPHFEPGVQPVSDEEYEEQVDRLTHGEIPSLNDFAYVAEEQKKLREGTVNES